MGIKFLNIMVFIFFILGSLFSQTENQIKQAKKIIKEQGLSENEVKTIAKSKGFSDEQIDMVIKKDSKQNFDTNKKEINDLDMSKIKPDEEVQETGKNENIIQASIDPPAVLGSPYFGYNIFSGNPELFQSSSFGAVSPDYLVGPGDEIIVLLWGETQFRQVLIVDREGFIFIPEIGQVFVNGLSLNLLESKLFKILSQSYDSINPQGRKATTFLDVSLGKLRPLRIQVLGEVPQPGAYTISPSTTLFSSLYYFNGPTILGSLRDIRLIRNNKDIASIDFYEYLLGGKMPLNEKLQLDDIIFIPGRGKSIAIKGQIKRPGIYELKSGEGFLDLLKICGGLKTTAYLERAKIDRIVPASDRIALGMDRMVIDINIQKVIEQKLPFELVDGDTVEVFSISDFINDVVTISGAVSRPGVYDYDQGLTISQLIDKADGLLGDAYLEKADLIRINSDLSEEILNINLNDILSTDSLFTFELKKQDKLRIYAINEMIPRKNVTLVGHVKNPGNYVLYKNMTLYDVLFKSGSFLDQDFLKKTYTKRGEVIRIKSNNNLKEVIPFNLDLVLKGEDLADLKLESNDLIKIYNLDITKSLGKVTLSGDVALPGIYDIKTNMDVIDLLFSGGGFSKNSELFKLIVSRPVEFPKRGNEKIDSYTVFVTKDLKIYNKQNSNKESSENFILKPNDFVAVYSNPIIQNQKVVRIEGAINFPGEYPIQHDKECVSSLIKRAGGFEPNSYPLASTLTRKGLDVRIDLSKIIKKPNSKDDVVLQEGDIFTIAVKPNITSVLGAVSAPGLYVYKKNKRVDYYLSIAGGISPEGNKKDIWVTLPNGVSRKYNRWLSNPKVLDGSIINVGIKKEDENFNWNEFSSDFSTLIVNFLQLVVLLNAIN